MCSRRVWQYRLHSPGVTASLGWFDDRRSALVDALRIANEIKRTVHIIDTRQGGGLVTVIQPPGTWDRDAVSSCFTCSTVHDLFHRAAS